MKQNMKKQRKPQVQSNDVDEQDFQELLQILSGFGDVEVLYNPDDPKDKDTTADDVVDRYKAFKNRHTSNKVKNERITHGSEVQRGYVKAARRIARRTRF